jgi:hypothetical protein
MAGVYTGMPDQTTEPAGDAAATARGIGQLNERPLHAALKDWAAPPGSRFEVPVDGYIIDIVAGEQLIEIQTGAFTPLRRKVRDLTTRHPLHLIHPIVRHKWIVRAEAGGQPRRRKSPRTGGWPDLFTALAAFPDMIAHPNFTLSALLVDIEEERVFDAARARRRRRGWVVAERRLLEVVAARTFHDASDFAAMLPDDLPAQFTTADLADGWRCQRAQAQRAAYCLRAMGALTMTGKRGNAIVYERAALSR